MPLQQTDTSAPLFELQQISKAFERHQALDGISFQVPKGHWIGILGESGSGKSTLLQIAARYLDADQGEVILDQTPLPTVASRLLKGHPDIKLVHQEFHLFPNQTVWENISYPIRLEVPEYVQERTEQLIELAGLQEVRDQKTKTLSGGEKQRTAIATALAELPNLLLLDETFAHLDGLNRSRLTRLFQRLKSKERQTCLFVTHAPTEAMDWADTLVVLRKGKIVQTGTPLFIYEQPIDAYVAELTGNVNWLDHEKSRFIRPEKVRVSKSLPLSNHVSAKVKHAHFRGIHWEYSCETANGLWWMVYRLRNDLKPGQDVFLRFSEKDVRTFS
jgi:ABC-type Fe3+/spermidine/putrescine transport system ATPase subunit